MCHNSDTWGTRVRAYFLLFTADFSHNFQIIAQSAPELKSSRKGLEGSKRGSQALNLSARPMRMVLALVQDWASSAAVPLMGGPRVGATSNPRPGIRAEGAPDSSIRWAPVHSLELITLRSSRPFADWTAVRCAVALSCTLSCLVVVTRE